MCRSIEEMIRPLLERLQSEIFKRQARVAMGPGATPHEPMEIQDSNEENKEEGVGVVQRIIKAMIEVGQTT
jgi:hypothetical protein